MNFLMMGALICGLAFFSCSDNGGDGEGEGNGNGAGDGGSGVTVLSKKVVKTVEYDEETPEQKDVTLYAYDAEGRLSKMTETNADETYSEVYTVTYSDNQIKIVRDDDDEDVEIYDLENGFVKKMSSLNSYYKLEATYTYEDEYLATSKAVGYNFSGDSWQTDLEESYTCEVKDGNLVKSVDEDYVVTVETSKVENNANIDIIYNDVVGWRNEFLLCIAGKRFKNLPARVEGKVPSTQEGYIVTYEYTVDKDGYVTKVVITDGEEGGDPYVSVMEIYYE